MRPSLLLAGALCAFAIGAPVAQAGTAGPGYAATDYVTEFQTFGGQVGPLGLAFDQSDRLFVIDRGDSRLYSFPPGGGRASDATAVSATAIPGTPFGLAITRDGRMYASRYGVSSSDFARVMLRAVSRLPVTLRCKRAASERLTRSGVMASACVTTASRTTKTGRRLNTNADEISA